MIAWTRSRRAVAESFSSTMSFALQREDARRAGAHPLQPLVNRGFADAEVAGGVGL